MTEKSHRNLSLAGATALLITTAALSKECRSSSTQELSEIVTEIENTKEEIRTFTNTPRQKVFPSILSSHDSTKNPADDLRVDTTLENIRDLWENCLKETLPNAQIECEIHGGLIPSSICTSGAVSTPPVSLIMLPSHFRIEFLSQSYDIDRTYLTPTVPNGLAQESSNLNGILDEACILASDMIAESDPTTYCKIQPCSEFIGRQTEISDRILSGKLHIQDLSEKLNEEGINVVSSTTQSIKINDSTDIEYLHKNVQGEITFKLKVEGQDAKYLTGLDKAVEALKTLEVSH